jgi:predicted permease
MLADLKFALRSLAKSPGFTAVALLTLALGIGVNTSMFTVTNTLLLQPLPFADAGRLVRVFRTSPQSQNWPHAIANFLDLRAQSRSFSHLAAYVWSSCNYAAPGQPAERLRGMDATADFFPLLGIAPELGRTFAPEEMRSGAAPVVVLSHESWEKRFVRDPGIIGRQIRIDGALATVVGVMPSSFVPRLLWGPVELWRPLNFSPQQEQNRENNFLSAIGRLAPGVSRAQAQSELTGIAARLTSAYPVTNSGNGLRLAPYTIQPDGAPRALTWLVTGLAGFVLLIACANLANLQFARTAGRAREFAIRLALGAPRSRIMRELLTESLLLALLGGACGLIVALWCNDLLGQRLVVGPTPGLALTIDPRVFAFTLAASALAGIAFGLLPAWFASKSDVNEVLKQQTRGSSGGRATHRLRHALIVAEVTLALTLLAGAGVFIRGLQHFTHRDAGWQPDALLLGDLALPDSKYPDNAARVAFFERLNQKLAESPLIQHAAITSSLPIWGYSSSTSFIAEGRPLPAAGTEPLTNLVMVNPAYFATIGLRLQQGRVFTADDRLGKPRVVVINETMARTLWPGENPLGRRLGDPDPAHHNWEEIVGVVADAGAPAGLNPPDTRFQMYRPIAQEAFSFATLAVRGSVAPDLLASELRRAVAALDPDQPVANVLSARSQITRSLANFNLIGTLLGGFALLGLALAALGIYGVLAGFVTQRTREIGIRMALGAQVRDVLRLIIGRGLQLALVGVALGGLGAFAVVRVFASILPTLGSPDPLVLAGVVVTLLAVTVIACWLPARRAARIDPIEALRAE